MTESSKRDTNVVMHEDRLEMSDGVVLRLVHFIRSPAASDHDPVIVFVPGLISSLQAWHVVIEELTTCYSVLYLETREKRSAVLPERHSVDFSMSRLCDDLCEVLEAKVPHTRPFCLMGSSLGSTMILEYLSRHEREPLVSLVIAPNAEFRGPSWLMPLAWIVPPRVWSILKPICKWYFCDFLLDQIEEPEQVARYRGYIEAAEPQRVRAIVLALARYRIWDTLREVTAPVVILAGRADRLHSLSTTKKIASKMLNARLEVMGSNRETHSARAALLARDAIIKAMSDVGTTGTTGENLERSP